MVHSSIGTMNANRYGLKFSAIWNKETISYLDLVLTNTSNKITTNTFFKNTDRNGYVPIQSCHHSKWLTAIPKGQYMQIRRKCNSIDTYNTQSAILTNRFIEKGYSPRALDICPKKVLIMNRDTLLTNNKKSHSEET